MDLLFRCETKFADISVASLIEFYTRIDKRMAWEGTQLYSSIEEVKTYPMNTSVFYYKLQQQQWPSAVKELLLLIHGVQLRGNRHYLVATSIDHPEFSENKTQRLSFKVTSNYFEASADGTGVKNTFIVSIPGKNQGAGQLTGSTAQSILQNFIQSVQNLKKLLENRHD